MIDDLRRATEPRAIIAALRSVLSDEELVAVAAGTRDVASGEQSWTAVVCRNCSHLS